MMKRLCISLLLIFAMFIPASAQESVSKAKAPPGIEASASKVEGLELPPDQNVNSDEGFVNIQAKCKGEVKWLVVSATKVKYVTLPQNTIIVSIPAQSGVTITVFAVGAVEGKLTDFARTIITVAGANPVPPVPNPPIGGPLHITFLVDLNNVTPDLANILNSQTLRQAITTKGNFFRLYDIKSPVVTQKKLDGIVQKVGGSSVMVIQRNDGFVVGAQVIPKTEAEVIRIISGENNNVK
jgi:hypothetical protein